VLVVYVDDFKLAGPAQNLPMGWKLIRKGINMDEPTPLGFYLATQTPCIYIYNIINN
jgi:hypothetical protein